MKRFSQKSLVMHEKELYVDLGERNTIFVCSGTDMFAPVVPAPWISAVIDKMGKHANTYLLQTKNPLRMFYYHDVVPKDTIFCTTIESDRDYPEIMGSSPNIQSRVAGMIMFKRAEAKRMVTVEPIMDFNVLELSSLLIQIDPMQVNIGADSKRHNLPEPSGWQVKKLIENLRRQKIPVNVKPNLKRITKE